MECAKWITPFIKQCFVVAGVSINMSQIGMVMGFSAVLLPQLKKPDSIIPIDISSGSWVAAIPGFALIAGNVLIPTIMAKWGRKRANLFSIIIILAGWICVVIANSLTWLLLARLLQGLSAGMSICLAPILIGEYTSPENRGAFSMAMTLVMAAATLAVHAIGSYVSWQMTSLVCSVITFVDLIIVLYSPETPSWLADQGRYEDCRKVFQWLRGEANEELEKMILANQFSRESRAEANVSQTVAGKMRSTLATVRRREFYKPIFIMIHIFTLGQWAGITILAPYAVDVINNVIGPNVDVALVIISMDVQRMFACVFAVFIIRKIKRRTMLFTTVGLNTLILIITAGYTYAKVKDMLPFDHPVIGGGLIHLHMVTVALGSLPLPYTIAGEIFPLQYRSLASGISAAFSSLNIFVCVKTFPFLVRYTGFHGAYCLYAGILVYCLLVAWFFLPETKDRTLQDIEEEFRGKPLSPDDLKTAQPLTTFKEVES